MEISRRENLEWDVTSNKESHLELKELASHIKDSISLLQTPDKKINVSGDTPNQVPKKITGDAFNHLVVLDKQTIAESSIESLIFQVILLLERDLEDFMGLSEDTLKQLQILYRESMKKSEEKHKDWLYSGLATQIAAALAPVAVSNITPISGIPGVDATLIAKGVSSTGTLFDGKRQQGISSSQDAKNLAASMKEEANRETQQNMKKYQDLMSFLQQVLQLRTQAARGA